MKWMMWPLLITAYTQYEPGGLRLLQKGKKMEYKEWKRRNKNATFTDNIIIYLENLKEFINY